MSVIPRRRMCGSPPTRHHLRLYCSPDPSATAIRPMPERSVEISPLPQRHAAARFHHAARCWQFRCCDSRRQRRGRGHSLRQAQHMLVRQHRLQRRDLRGTSPRSPESIAEQKKRQEDDRLFQRAVIVCRPRHQFASTPRRTRPSLTTRPPASARDRCALLDPARRRQQNERRQRPDYMYMWTQILEGRQRLGEDFNFFYFAGPTDFAGYFKLTGQGDLDALEDWSRQAGGQRSCLQEIGRQRQLHQGRFTDYYGLRASVVVQLRLARRVEYRAPDQRPPARRHRLRHRRPAFRPLRRPSGVARRIRKSGGVRRCRPLIDSGDPFIQDRFLPKTRLQTSDQPPGSVSCESRLRGNGTCSRQ